MKKIIEVLGSPRAEEIASIQSEEVTIIDFFALLVVVLETYLV